MALKLPVPGLRPVYYDARSAAKVQLTVQPGDTLIVSDDVAAQLEQGSAQFKVDKLPPEEPNPTPTPEPEKPVEPAATTPKPKKVRRQPVKKS